MVWVRGYFHVTAQFSFFNDLSSSAPLNWDGYLSRTCGPSVPGFLLHFYVCLVMSSSREQMLKSVTGVYAWSNWSGCSNVDVWMRRVKCRETSTASEETACFIMCLAHGASPKAARKSAARKPCQSGSESFWRSLHACLLFIRVHMQHELESILKGPEAFIPEKQMLIFNSGCRCSNITSLCMLHYF